MVRAALLAALVCAGAAAAGPTGLSLAVEGGPLSFQSTPLARPTVLHSAARVLVQSPRAEWTLKVRALGPLVCNGDARSTLPPERLRVALAGSGRWLPLSNEDQTLLAAQPPTPGAGRVIPLDYAFDAQTAQGKAAPAGQYSTRLSFTATGAGLDDAYVDPNPLVPGADRAAALHFALGTAQPFSARVIGPHGVVRRLRALGPSRAGAQLVAWDGKDARGRLVSPGPYTIEIDDASDAPIADADVWLEAPAEQAMTGTVFGIAGKPVASARVYLRAADGTIRSTTSDASGAYRFAPLQAGSYGLSARQPGFDPFDSPALEVEGGELHYDIHLTAEAALQLALTTGQSHAAVGELVPVDLAVRALAAKASSLKAAFTVGEGLKAVPGSLTIDGARVDAPLDAVPLGDLQPGQVHRLSFLVALTVGKGARELTGSVSGSSAGAQVQAGPAKVRIQASAGELSGLGGIFGRLCYDLNRDGRCEPKEPPARKGVVFLEEGSWAEADDRGRFHFAPVLPGAHQLLAGPGPLELGARPGAMPKLPRHNTGTREVQLLAGQYQVADVALPVPPGYRPQDYFRDDDVDSLDEGDTAPLPDGNSGPAPKLVEADEGAVDPNGNLMGTVVLEPHPSAPQSLLAGNPNQPFEHHPPPEKTPDALNTTPAASSTALLGVGEGWLGFDLGGGGLAKEGRLAFTLQHDFKDLGRATLTVDSARDGRQLSLSLLDPLGGQFEFGDDARVRMSQEEKLALRFDLQNAYLQVGTLSAGLTEGELIYQSNRLVGAELGASTSGGGATVRAFVGFNPDAPQMQVFPGNDATGPFFVSGPPVLPGSEEVDIELRRADGEVLQRLRQQPFVDYFIDYERGQIDLSRPLPSRTDAGDLVFLVVRYQPFSGSPLLSGLTAGGRAQLGRGDRHLGLTGLYQQSDASPLTALSLDGAYSLGPALLEGEVGTEPFAPGPWHARSSERVRLTARLGEGVSLFGYGLSNGADWKPTIRSSPLDQTSLTPFSLLDGAGGSLLSQPSLSLLLAEGRAFPFFLSETPGETQWGAGTVSDFGPVRGLALIHSTKNATGETTQSADLGARANVGEHVRIYATETTSAKAGELLTTPTAPRERQTLLGAQATLGDLDAELDYRHTRIDAPDPADAALNQQLELKLRYRLSRWLEPTVGLEQDWLKGAALTGVERRIAAGFESHPTAWATAFAYLVQESGPQDSQSQPGALAGFRVVKGSDAQLSFRYELRRLALKNVHAFSWQARYRLLPSLTLESDGSAAIGDPNRQLRVALAFVPTTALRLLGRFTDAATASGPSSRVGDLDAHLQLLKRLSLDAKALMRIDGGGEFSGRAGLGALALDTSLGGHFDLRAGGRVIRDASGTAAGGFAEVGYSFSDLLRAAVGVNLAQRKEVFTIDRQAPGVFVHLTAGFGGEVGHSTPPPSEAPEETAPVVAPPRPERPAAPPPPSALPPRPVSGAVFVDVDGDGRRGAHEPVLAEVTVHGGSAVAKSDAKGQFAFSALPGEVSELSVDEAELPLGYAPVKVAIGKVVKPEVDVPLRAAPIDLARPFTIHTGGKAYQAVKLDALSTSLAAWVAGLPLSADEANGLERVSQRVFTGADLRIVAIAHAQTMGAPDGAFKRANKGVHYLERYLRAAQMVPGKRILIEVVPPVAGVKDPLGHVDVLLVKLTPEK